MKIEKKFEKIEISPTPDLIQYFEKHEYKQLRNKNLRINLLDVDQALKRAKGISYLNLSSVFGLVPLEDGENSNPFCYITKGILRGKIFHLYHDDSSHIEFNSLEDFKEKIKNAINERTIIDDLDWEKEKITCDQNLLKNEISRLIDENSGKAREIAMVYLKLLDGSDLDIFDKLANNEDFFVQQAAADRLFELKKKELLEVAQKIANAQHPQAKSAGERAVKEILKSIH